MNFALNLPCLNKQFLLANKFSSSSRKSKLLGNPVSDPNQGQVSFRSCCESVQDLLLSASHYQNYFNQKITSKTYTGALLSPQFISINVQLKPLSIYLQQSVNPEQSPSITSVLLPRIIISIQF